MVEMSTKAASKSALLGPTASVDSPILDPVLWILAAVNFLIGMGGFLIVSLFTPIQTSLGLSVSETGSLISLYALVYALSSPIGVALTGKQDRKAVVIGCLLVFAISSAMVATAGGYLEMIYARTLSAVAAGIITPVTASIAISISSLSCRGRALARVFLGFTLAQAAGIPLGSYLGHTLGWEVVFFLIFALAIVTTILMSVLMPTGIEVQKTDLGVLVDVLFDSKMMISVLCSSTFIVGIYTLYTFLEPLFVQELQFGHIEITMLFLVFGCGAVVGNQLGGVLNDHIGSSTTLYLLCIAQILISPIFSFLPSATPLILLLTLLWSVFGWSFMIAQQSRLVSQAPEKQSVLLALNSAAIYIGAAIGSVLGGIVLVRFGINALGIAGGIFALLALGHLLYSDNQLQS